jgi:hypothetical protein
MMTEDKLEIFVSKWNEKITSKTQQKIRGINIKFGKFTF